MNNLQKANGDIVVELSLRNLIIRILIIITTATTLTGFSQTFLSLQLQPNTGMVNAVTPVFSNLAVGTNYQLQVSFNLNTWTNQGAAFTATNSSMVYAQSFAVTNCNQLFFRLQTVSPTIYNPVFFDADSANYYALSVHGSLGNEYIEIDTTNQNQATPFSLYDLDSGGFYTISIIGNAGDEVIEIDPSFLTEIDKVYLYNPDIGAYYVLTVSGTSGNESLSINPVP
jgi:hypothetical protein